MKIFLRKLLDIVVFPLLWSLCAFMRWAPGPLGLAAARGSVFLLRLVMPRMSAVAHRNLALVFPHAAKEHHTRILSASFYMLAKNILSFARLPDFSVDLANRRYDVTDFLRIAEAARRDHPGKGLILASLHFGCFEEFCQTICLLHRPLAILARGLGLPLVDGWINARREKFGNVVFSRLGGYDEMVRHLREDRDVGILLDQNVKINHATFVDFFKIKAATSKAVGLAALRVKAPVVFCASVEYAPDRFRVLAERIEIPGPEEGSFAERVDEITRRIHMSMERAILAHPEHWLWTHRRFKTRPSGETETIYQGC